MTVPILLLVLFLLLPLPTAGRVVTTGNSLVVGFYARSCPQAENIVHATAQLAFLNDPFLPPKLLRLAFHDCFVQGCDGSILLDSPSHGQNNFTNNQERAEKDDPANASVDGYEIIDAIKAMIEDVCPGIVSCADIIALASRDAVALMGGPRWSVPTGRLDGKISLASSVRLNIPDTMLSFGEINSLFNSKGLTMTDLITLSGAHTIGRAHCSAFNDRFSFINGSLVPNDSTFISTNFSDKLMKKCPFEAKPKVTTPLDQSTPTLFDNAYFQNLEVGEGLMHSDQILFHTNNMVENVESREVINLFSRNQSIFFENWKLSMVRLTSIGLKTKRDGEIRRNCRSIN